MLFYNFLIILNKTHLVTDEADDQDGNDSVIEGRPVRNFNLSHKHKQLKQLRFFTFIGCLLYELTSYLKLHL